MMLSFKKISFLLLLMVIALPALAGEPIGKVVFVKGRAFVTHFQEPTNKSLAFNDAVFAMDQLETSKGELKVLLNDETILSLGENSKLLITEYVYHPKQSRKSIFDILDGTVRTIIQKAGLTKSDVTLQTPTAVAGIRGTDVGITVHGKVTRFACFEGKFEAFFKDSPQNKVVVQTGQITEIKGAPPSEPAPIPPQVTNSFSGQMKPDSADEVMDQPGAEGLHEGPKDQPPGEPNGGPPPRGDKPGENQGQPDQGHLQEGQQPPPPGGMKPPGFGPGPGPNGPGGPKPPPLLPGGKPQTPPEAAGPGGPSGPPPSRAPVDIPVSFPTEAQ